MSPEASGENRSGSFESPLGTLYRCACGMLFASEWGLNVHKGTCEDAAEEEGDRDGHTDLTDKSINVSTNTNDDYDTLVEWLDEATADGETVDFKARQIADDIGLSPHQIGMFMAAIDRSDETEYEVNRLSYTSATHWEVWKA